MSEETGTGGTPDAPKAPPQGTGATPVNDSPDLTRVFQKGDGHGRTTVLKLIAQRMKNTDAISLIEAHAPSEDVIAVLFPDTPTITKDKDDKKKPDGKKEPEGDINQAVLAEKDRIIQELKLAMAEAEKAQQERTKRFIAESKILAAVTEAGIYKPEFIPDLFLGRFVVEVDSENNTTVYKKGTNTPVVSKESGNPLTVEEAVVKWAREECPGFFKTANAGGAGTTGDSLPSDKDPLENWKPGTYEGLSPDRRKQLVERIRAESPVNKL